MESGLDLVDPALDRTRLRDVVTSFHAFWRGTEPLLDRWAAARPGLAGDLQWSRRRRVERLARDVDRLGGAPDLPAPAVFDDVDDAAVLGWLYVTEGSTLGGAVISRALLRIDPTLELESFLPYREGPGPMWRSYVEQLGLWTGDDELRTERVVAAGVTVFTALADHTAPLAKDAAA